MFSMIEAKQLARVGHHRKATPGSIIDRCYQRQLLYHKVIEDGLLAGAH